jgi:hypothetical protein
MDFVGKKVLLHTNVTSHSSLLISQQLKVLRYSNLGIIHLNFAIVG